MYFFKLKSHFLFLGFISFSLLIGCGHASDAEKKGAINSTSAQAGSTKKAPTISIAEKKANFFGFLAPLIKQANNDILKQRNKLLTLKKDISNLSSSQKVLLASFVKKYRVNETLSVEDQISQLETKINTIPAALILAQAANESAWGTSRFATKGNNYFGQWCFKKGCGLIPNNRNTGAVHEVAKFKNAFESVTSYLLNLNRHSAYERLRTLRKEALDRNEAITGEALAEGLIAYSERKEEYVKEIQGMIRFNKLERFDAEAI